MTGFWERKAGAIIGTFILGASILLTGCGSQEQMEQTKTAVKAMKIMQQDAPVSYGYPGQLKGMDEVAVHSRISGNIVEKYFKGGEMVQAGAPLYRIDSRQYESSLYEAQANLHKAESALRKSRDDLARYEALWRDKAISEQSLINKREEVASDLATVESEQAAVRKAQQNLDDAVVYAPLNGQTSVDDVAVGTYTAAGSTKLVTVGSLNPINVQFSISETEYLNILAEAVEAGALESNSQPNIPKIKVILSNGEEYPVEGEITAADRAFQDNSGSLTIKAQVANPYGVLLPGMFARVRFVGVTVPNAILVPQRSIQQLLDESFVLLVGEDGKAISKKVELGEKVGSYYIVKKGISAGDTVIVDGLTSLQAGQDLDVTMVTADEMGFTMVESADIVDRS
ncbi:efflux RND transporter periplasmic adaptor subunit [Selenomonas sp.]|uniref:efflux RND transporter periplasmic adaptor subunit n=1 Tax=Selenomonas sp. TaxID=2053611 RepID=UPI0025D39091|nr:efflux RND transporter periplasmic adaptor subunit [Selenomonas sp.]